MRGPRPRKCRTIKRAPTPQRREGPGVVEGIARHFSQRAGKLKASDVRELLKLLQLPDMISFAGGFPNPESFPTEIIRQIVNDVLQKDGAATLQYGITEGYAPLRESVADRMRARGMAVDKDNVLIVSGSQQVIDLMGKIFVDPGDIVLISAPTYLTALTGFSVYEASFETVPIDEDNMRMDLFEERMARLAKRATVPEIVYVLPNFHNPAGVTMPEKNRKRLVDLASEYDFIILEDDPYRELRYRGEDIRPIKSFDTEGRVVYMGSFSKILSPGLRVGYVLADPEIIKKLVIAKQSADVCTSVLSQRIAHEYVVRGHIDPQIAAIRQLYGRKLDLMLRGLKEYMPEGVKWVRPDGGMFLWATLPEGLNSPDLLESALKKRVAFVSGRAFFPDPKDGAPYMRLNFTHPTDDMITEGLKRLGAVVNQEMVSKWDRSGDASDKKIQEVVRGETVGRT